MRQTLSPRGAYLAAIGSVFLSEDECLNLTRRYLIIGYGIAGLSAARAIRRHDQAGQITIVTDERAPFYSRPGLAYYLTGVVPETQLFPLTASEKEDLELRLIHARAEAIFPAEHFVQFPGNKRLSYDRLLLATGAGARKPDMPGVDLAGVVTLDTLADARQILKHARRAKRAVVIGGGITAVEIAEGFAARNVETHYFLRGDRFWPRVLDERESALVEHGLAEEGIVLHHNLSVKEARGNNGRLQAVVMENGQQFKCQLLGIAIGIQPNTSLASSAGLALDRGILVDETLQSSAPDIYAAGDVAQVFDPQTSDYRLDSLWWQAKQQGQIAGANMAGNQQAYLRSVPMNVTRVGGVVTSIIGSVGQGRAGDDLVSIVHGDSENWRHQPDSFSVESGEGANRLRLVIGERALVGAVIMGDQRLADTVHQLILNQTSLGRFRQLLIQSPEKSMDVLTELAQKYKRDHIELSLPHSNGKVR